jgi:uncharacterized membrane protein
MSYLTLKLIHILSATLLLGTGMGIAFFMFMAVRTGNLEHIRRTARHVVLADWLFTTPAVITQLATGIALMKILGYSFSSAWFYWVIGLFILVGACWIPVVFIQIKLRNLAQAELLPEQFRKLFTIWIYLGIPAFISVLAIFYLMVFKPSLF